MAGRPSATTLAELSERLSALEGAKEGQTNNPAPLTWSAELETRVAALEERLSKLEKFLKKMYSL